MNRLCFPFLTRFPVLMLVLAAALCGWSAQASARVEQVLHPVCHAVVNLGGGQDDASRTAPTFPRFTCKGKPAHYQQSALWFRFDLPTTASSRATALDAQPGSPVLMVGNSRFDRLDVFFRYRDGAVRHQSVETGRFGSHWRAGGQIAFEAPDRDEALSAIILRFEKPASADLLRLRLVDEDELQWEATALAGIIGAALTLLAVGALYNLTLALTARRSFSFWQSAWAACMFVWGALWSQLGLFVWPEIAGAPSAQICTALSCLAILCATFSAVTALEGPLLPRGLRDAALALAVLVGLLGVPIAIMREGPIETLGSVLGGLVLLDLLAVAWCLGLAWRRGSQEARAYVGAWIVPMITLALIEFAQVDLWFYGAGSQIVILSAAAWQTLFLSVAASRASGRLRSERDLALRSEEKARELARLDPLTGLRNRRGFMEVIEPMLQRAANVREDTFGLLLIDIDRFKQVNDTYGHDAGDEVLVTIARRLQAWEDERCKVARLGGEEFALAVSGLDGFALMRFADTVRREISACEHCAALEGDPVTISIGLAVRRLGGEGFRDLYRRADAALYEAKNAGRNKVVASPEDGLGAVAGGAEPTQPAIAG